MPNFGKTEYLKRMVMEKQLKKLTLRELMNRDGLSNGSLGAMLDPPKCGSAVSRYNSKQRRVSISDANRLAEIFGVGLNDLDII